MSILDATGRAHRPAGAPASTGGQFSSPARAETHTDLTNAAVALAGRACRNCRGTLVPNPDGGWDHAGAGGGSGGCGAPEPADDPTPRTWQDLYMTSDEFDDAREDLGPHATDAEVYETVANRAAIAAREAGHDPDAPVTDAMTEAPDPTEILEPATCVTCRLPIVPDPDNGWVHDGDGVTGCGLDADGQPVPPESYARPEDEYPDPFHRGGSCTACGEGRALDGGDGRCEDCLDEGLEPDYDEPDGDDIEGECDRCGRDLTGSQVVDGYCPDCDDDAGPLTEAERYELEWMRAELEDRGTKPRDLIDRARDLAEREQMFGDREPAVPTQRRPRSPLCRNCGQPHSDPTQCM